MASLMLKVNGENSVMVSEECTFSKLAHFMLGRYTAIEDPLLCYVLLKTDDNVVFKICKDPQYPFQEYTSSKSDRFLSWRATVSSTVNGSDEIEITYKTGASDVKLSCFVISCSERYPSNVRNECFELCRYVMFPSDHIEKQKLVNWYLQSFYIFICKHGRIEIGRSGRSRHAKLCAITAIINHGTYESVLCRREYSDSGDFNQALSTFMEFLEKYVKQPRVCLDGYKIQHYDVQSTYFPLIEYASSNTRYNRIVITYSLSYGVVIIVYHTKKSKIVYDSRLTGKTYPDLFSAFEDADAHIRVL